ncbi:alcohol acetyltransferase [Mycena maculata]|uniref:Alcohol acetyltransferase n=1 Tax=Mycena maculata TaxID=230809 RepID=A0AAD7P2N1_9AGAR|nr:alcohol acetyltransferase [Mycena maculata]
MSTTRLRQIGLLERYSATRNFLILDSCVVSSARYTAGDGSPLSAETLFPALQILIETHAPLGVRFEGREDGSDVAFVRLPTLDLSRIVTFSRHKNLRGAMEKHFAQGFDTQSDTPLWRLEVLSDNTVLFAVHHAIGDGLSGAAFHKSLIHALRASRPLNSSPRVAVPDIPLLAPIEDLTDVKPSLIKFGREVYRTIVPSSKARSAWTGHPVPEVPNLETHVRFLTLPALDTKDFSAACRSHQASVTSVLYVLTVCALARLLANDPAHYKTTSANVAISLRGIAGIADDVMCNYVSLHHTFPSLDTEFSWEHAARYAAELQQKKHKSRGVVGLLRFLTGRYVDYMSDLLGKKREAGFVLSNLGRFQAPPGEGQWSIGEVFFGQCDVVVGAAFSMNVVGDPSGALNISFTWGETSVEGTSMETFISIFQKLFHSLPA